jgi:hypothetical protein
MSSLFGCWLAWLGTERLTNAFETPAVSEERGVPRNCSQYRKAR